MDSIYAIGLGLALRVVVDTASQNNLKIGGTLVGLWEGIVLYHFLGKMPRSFDPYVAYGFRLFVDFLFTESLSKLAIVLLWTGMGVLLSDIGPAIWKDSGLRRVYRRTGVRLPRLPFVPKVGIPTRRTVQFWDSPTTPSSAASDITETVLPVPPPRPSGLRHRSLSPARSRALTPPRSRTPPLRPSLTSRRSRGPPGAFPGVWSETETDISSITPTSLTSDDDTSSDSGTAIPDRSHIPDIDGVLAAELALDDLQEPTPTRESVALPPVEEAFQIIESDEVQPPFDQVPVIPDTGSSAHLPIPPMPVAEVPKFDAPLPLLPPPVPEKLPTVHERDDISAAGVPLPPSDDRTVAPPYEEWTHVEDAESDISPPESILSGGRNSLITRANLLREQADEEDKIRAHLEKERKKLTAEGNVKDAFLLLGEVKEAEERAKKLHDKAERRYFDGTKASYFYANFTLIFLTGYNKETNSTTIDVHKLKVAEAIQRTEKAIRDVLLQGGAELRVITAGKIVKGTHLAIIKAMQE